METDKKIKPSTANLAFLNQLLFQVIFWLSKAKLQPAQKLLHWTFTKQL